MRFLDHTGSPFSELLDLVESDPDCKEVLRNWNADRKVVTHLYRFLMRAGARTSVNGQFVPCHAVADPWTLEYLLASRSASCLDRDAAFTVIDYFSSDYDRDVLLQSEVVAAAITVGPEPPPRVGVYRPYCITAMHRERAVAPGGEAEKGVRVRLKRWLWPVLKVIGGIVAIPACIAGLLLLSALFELAAYVLIAGALVAAPISSWCWMRSHTLRDAVRAILRGIKLGIAFVVFHGAMLVLWLPLFPVVRWMDQSYGLEWWMAAITAMVASVFSIYATVRYLKFVGSLDDSWLQE